MALSITISRDVYETNEIEELAELFEEKNVQFYLAEEFGETGQHAHIQGIVFTTQRSNNLRKTISNRFEYEYDIINLKISKCKDGEENFVLGYCQKECPERYFTNIGDDTLDRALEYYTERKESLKNSRKEQKWVCTGLNHLFPSVYNWVNENNVKNKFKIVPLVQVMCATGALPLSLAGKITEKKHQVIWSQFLSYKDNEDERCNFDHMINEAIGSQEMIDDWRK